MPEFQPVEHETKQGGRFLIIRNPVAGWRRQRTFGAYVKALEATGAAWAERATSGPGEATRLAAEVGPGFSAVIAAGGDGTINEVINGLVALRDRQGWAPPLGVFPLGTANVYAAEVGLPFAPAELAECLVVGRTRPLRLGTVRELGEAKAPVRHFVLMAGAGFDAQVVSRVDPAIKKLLGKGAYAIETLGTIVRGDAACPTVMIEGRERPTSSAIVVNARYYAGRFVLSKKASPFSPGMDLCLFHKAGRQAAIGYLVRVALGQIENSPVYSIEHVASFDITGPGGSPIQADGDIVAHAPARISMAETALEAIVSG
ncbi:MAG: diacylglycerol kinase family protein [Pseudomonadota bacterium]